MLASLGRATRRARYFDVVVFVVVAVIIILRPMTPLLLAGPHPLTVSSGLLTHSARATTGEWRWLLLLFSLLQLNWRANEHLNGPQSQTSLATGGIYRGR